MDKKLVEAIKSGNVKRFYNNKVWIRKRKQILERDNNECQKCKGEGRYHKAESVHHIKHLKKYPHLALVDSNLISLCNECHNVEHPEKFGQLTKASKERFTNTERW